MRSRFRSPAAALMLAVPAFAQTPADENPLAPPGPSAPPPVLPGLDSKALHPLFDGKTLTGWNGDPAVWTVSTARSMARANTARFSRKRISATSASS